MEFIKKYPKIFQWLFLLIIFFTYVDRDRSPKEAIIPQEKQKKIKEQLSNNSETGDIFYNIEYSGFDLAGNRYIIKSAEAFNNKNNQEIVNMKLVEALFYFKNGTILKAVSYTHLTLPTKRIV